MNPAANAPSLQPLNNCNAGGCRDASGTFLQGTGNTLLSTEAVLYRDPAAAEQGLAELRKVRAECPDTPVVSPVNMAERPAIS